MELHLSPRVVGRGSKGRTACGSAAYRNCSKIIDNNGNVHNYKYKKEWVAGGVELPAGASEELRNPQTLWQRHEKNDIRKDAQLYRDIEFSVPNELSFEAVGRVAKGMAAKLTKEGMCVQWDVHDKYTWKDEDGNVVTSVRAQDPNKTYTENRNLHVHMMVTMRELKEDGTFGNKNRSWNNYNGGLNIADLLRPEAARLMNEELARIGSSEKVEHESYADRGIDKIPTKHVGVSATAMERKGIKTNKGRRERYVKWLNQIHAKNLRQVETQTQSGRLEDLIAGARAQQGGNDAFKDWDALFAMLRDTRRCRAAMNSELGKLGKIISAYEKKDNSYLEWAGCDPESEAQKMTVQAMQNELRIRIKEMDITETFLLDSKELYKAHNRAVYASKKVAWDKYQKERSERGMAYCEMRLESLRGYMDHLRNTISLFDALFNTPAFQEYCATIRDLERQEKQFLAEYARNRETLKQSKKDFKEHKKAAKQAERDEKRLRRELDKEER